MFKVKGALLAASATSPPSWDTLVAALSLAALCPASLAALCAAVSPKIDPALPQPIPPLLFLLGFFIFFFHCF
jgi:hypothetical protein